MINEIVATYDFGGCMEYRVEAVYSCQEDRDQNRVAFYNVYERRDGDEIEWILDNPGKPYYFTAPTWDDIYKYHYRPSYI